jgi:FkbM family methyltransferase
VSLSQLSRVEVPGYGPVWFGGRCSPSNARRLAEEVDEYFGLGLSLAPSATVVDVGANVGMFAIAAGARAPGVRIVAIEPIPRLHDALARNFAESAHLQSSRGRSRLVRAGLTCDGDEREAEFTYFTRLPTDSTRYLDGKHVEFERAFETWGDWVGRAVEARVPGRAGRWAGRKLAAIVSAGPRGRVRGWLADRVAGAIPVRCPMRTLGSVLDELESPVDVLKIDVEGAELDVLNGARDEQWSQIRQVVL